MLVDFVGYPFNTVRNQVGCVNVALVQKKIFLKIFITVIK